MADSLLADARAGDPAAFADLVQPYRAELGDYCYRLLASVVDAEVALDATVMAVREALPDSPEGPALRTWLYAVATAVCLGWEDAPPRAWPEPWPTTGPAEFLDPAYLAALQRLPLRARAAVLLRDTVDIPTSTAGLPTVAELTGWAEPIPAAPTPAVPSEPAPEGFAEAWAAGDLGPVLHPDVWFATPPTVEVVVGRDAVVAHVAETVPAGEWRLLPVSANGGPAFACHLDGQLEAITLVRTRGGLVTELTAFLDPDVHRAFGLPTELPG